MFDLFDVDHDGNIDEKEFFFAMNFLGIQKSFVKVGMDEVKLNGDRLFLLTALRDFSKLSPRN